MGFELGFRFGVEGQVWSLGLGLGAGFLMVFGFGFGVEFGFETRDA